MSKRRSQGSKKKRNARNSMFDTPNVRQQIVKTKCYADINFNSPADLDACGSSQIFQLDAAKRDPPELAPARAKLPKKKCRKCRAKSMPIPKPKSPPSDEASARDSKAASGAFTYGEVVAWNLPSACAPAHRKPTARRKSSATAAGSNACGERHLKSQRPQFECEVRPVYAKKGKPHSQPCPKFNFEEIAACEQTKNGESILLLDSARESHERLPSRAGLLNLLHEVHAASYCLHKNWLEQHRCRWIVKRKERLQQMMDAATPTQQIEAEQSDPIDAILEGFKKIKLADVEEASGEDDCSSQIEATKTETENGRAELELVELTASQHACLVTATYGPLSEVLIFKFGLNITRRDIHTLLARNWLNDEVINFYMNLLIERAERKHATHGLPRVYAMNTFFMPRLLQSGYDGVRRWTRKVDLFEKDIILVPVHTHGMHWCMAIIDLRNRSIKYYDSLGGLNPKVLTVLKDYLQAESWGKRNQCIDMADFRAESARHIPRQLNGSDCGVFSCMFAECICANRPITFTQANMPYFRQRMILEILRGELLH